MTAADHPSINLITQWATTNCPSALLPEMNAASWDNKTALAAVLHSLSFPLPVADRACFEREIIQNLPEESRLKICQKLLRRLSQGASPHSEHEISAIQACLTHRTRLSDFPGDQLARIATQHATALPLLAQWVNRSQLSDVLLQETLIRLASRNPEAPIWGLLTPTAHIQKAMLSPEFVRTLAHLWVNPVSDRSDATTPHVFRLCPSFANRMAQVLWLSRPLPPATVITQGLHPSIDAQITPHLSEHLVFSLAKWHTQRQIFLPPLLKSRLEKKNLQQAVQTDQTPSLPIVPKKM